MSCSGNWQKDRCGRQNARVQDRQCIGTIFPFVLRCIDFPCIAEIPECSDQCFVPEQRIQRVRIPSGTGSSADRSARPPSISCLGSDDEIGPDAFDLNGNDLAGCQQCFKSPVSFRRFHMQTKKSLGIPVPEQSDCPDPALQTPGQSVFAVCIGVFRFQQGRIKILFGQIAKAFPRGGPLL